MRNLQVGTYEHITVTPVSGSLGAEIGGVDLATELSDEVVAEIRRAWLDHLVVFFHDQGHLTNAQYVAFARRIGEPSAYPFVKGFDDQPEIIPLRLMEPPVFFLILSTASAIVIPILLYIWTQNKNNRDKEQRI